MPLNLCCSIIANGLIGVFMMAGRCTAKLILAISAFAAACAYAQTYPTNPLRIVTSGIGGSPDVASRLIAAAMSGPLGQQVIVDNRGSGVLPGEMVAQAAP